MAKQKDADLKIVGKSTGSDKDAITQHHLNNLETNNAVVNKDGSTSTVRTIQVDIDGKPTLIPTVWGGKIVSNDEAARRAIESGVQWPTAKSHEELRKFDEQIHKSFEADLKALPSSRDKSKKKALLDAIVKGQKPSLKIKGR